MIQPIIYQSAPVLPALYYPYPLQTMQPEVPAEGNLYRSRYSGSSFKELNLEPDARKFEEEAAADVESDLNRAYQIIEKLRNENQKYRQAY